MNKKNVKRGLMPYLFLIVFVCIVYFVFSSLNQKEHKLSYDEFVKVAAHKSKDIVLNMLKLKKNICRRGA